MTVLDTFRDVDDYEALTILTLRNLTRRFMMARARCPASMFEIFVIGMLAHLPEWNIRIRRESRIEKSVPRIAVWHHEACRVMTNGDLEGRIFLSYPHE